MGIAFLLIIDDIVFFSRKSLHMLRVLLLKMFNYIEIDSVLQFKSTTITFDNSLTKVKNEGIFKS